MKKINKIFLELYKDRKQLGFLSVLITLSYWINSFMFVDTSVTYATGALIGVAVLGAGVTLYNSAQSRAQAQGLANDAEKRQLVEQAKLEEEKAKFEAMTFKNPYENVENVYEDITINQQQAQFEAQQGQQQRANIMQQFRGAAGGAGIAGLAQAMASQGQLQAQRISASIGQQEATAQRLRAQGEWQAEMAERGGEQWLQQVEGSRRSTLLGMQYGAATGANEAFQESLLNQQQINQATREAGAEAISDIMSAVVKSDFSSAKKLDPGTSGIDPSNKSGMVEKMDRDINSPTYGKIIKVPASKRFE